MECAQANAAGRSEGRRMSDLTDLQTICATVAGLAWMFLLYKIIRNRSQ